MTEEASEHNEDFIFKMTTVIGGIYLFLLVERILQSIMDKRKVWIQRYSTFILGHYGVKAFLVPFVGAFKHGRKQHRNYEDDVTNAVRLNVSQHVVPDAGSDAEPASTFSR